MGEYKEIAAKLKEADAILIGASNGFSISEGLHIFADNQAFEEVFGDFKRAYGIRNILSGLFADWPSEEVKWAFLSRLIYHYSIGYTGSQNTEALKTLIGDKPYFFVTSNGENHFELAGFSPDCIWEIEGSWKEMQCEQGCHDTLYPLFPLIPEMAASEKNMKIPSELVPRCPKCGGTMIGHSPQRHMTAADREIQRRFQNFVQKYHGKKLVVLELGIGWRNQLIKAPLMNLVKKEPYAAYITINKGEIYIPNEIAAKSYGLDGDMTEILERLKKATEERNEGWRK